VFAFAEHIRYDAATVTHVVSDPATFAAEAAAGFAAAYPEHVRPVAGGVVRVAPAPAGKAAVVIGGGSGHYPLFSGFVGAGLADGAVMGDVFASPSARAAESVIRAAERGGGCLLTFGNYAGDVLHFGAAAEALRAAGIDTRILTVTDDIASASPDEGPKRRGVAGGIIVYKLAGAAAERLDPLDDVERVARHANARTRSIGVAFAGCTLPGAGAPLFTLPLGSMGIGLGIHGEPGVAEGPVVPAGELADLLVARVLDEAPADAGPRAAVLLNGLGATKYEELFVLWNAVLPRLRAAGLEPVLPLVGEYTTSLDMAGCSLSVTWLDDELDPLWAAPCDTPAFRRGAVAGHGASSSVATDPATAAASAPTEPSVPPASRASRAAAPVIVGCLEAMHAALSANEERLGALDAWAGDGDHGRGMVRGAFAALEHAEAAATAGAGAGTTLSAAADAWADRGGGTSGALWGEALRALGAVLGDTAEIDAATVSAAVDAARDAVARVGGAVSGDKTMLDAMAPFADALREAIGQGVGLIDAVRSAAIVAGEAAEATSALAPRIGRARPLAERSLGHPDPGAVSFALCADAVGRALAEA
jgi:dihydroxyacetone kinase